MADCELIIEEQNNVIMTDSEMTLTENEEAEVTVITEASHDHSGTSTLSSTSSTSVKSRRSVAWCYFDKASDDRSKCMLRGKILKDCGNTTNLFKVNTKLITCGIVNYTSHTSNFISQLFYSI